MKAYKIYTYTIINVPTNEFKSKVPYAIAVVEADEQKFLTRLDDYSEGTQIAIGDTVYYKEKDDLGNVICTIKKS